LYNGANPSSAVTYNTLTQPNFTTGFDSFGYQYSVFELPTNGLENGGNDGMALVAPNGSVIELWSYEGIFNASNGAAMGRTSVDVLVAETGNTAVGFSLQRVNFTNTWIGPLASTKGAFNIALPPPPNATFRFIHDIQGTGAQVTTSEYVNVSAIVTSLFSLSDALNGFWMQEEDVDADTNLNTSEGIFVVCAAKCPINLLVGSLVNVLGNTGQSSMPLVLHPM
jgi:uncharacterized protein